MTSRFVHSRASDPRQRRNDALLARNGVAGSTVSLAYSVKVKALNPVVYYRLGEAAGTVAVDEEGLQNGTYTSTGDITLGVASQIAGDADTAVTFGGTTGHVVIGQPSAIDIDPGTDELAISFWIKTTATSGAIIAKTAAAGSRQVYLLMENTGKIRSLSGATADFSSTNTINNGAWKHIVANFIDLSGTIFGVFWIGGVFDAGSVAAIDSSTNAFDWLIAARRGSDNTDTGLEFAGSLDEIAIFDRALNDEEIRALSRGSSIG